MEQKREKNKPNRINTKQNIQDIVIIGGGPAGLAAAIAARKAGIERIVIIERDHRLGGILNQCIHNGFGLHTFQEELTGPEYAGRYVKMVEEAGILYRTDTMVMDIRAEESEDEGAERECEKNRKTGTTKKGKSIHKIAEKQVIVMNAREGMQTIRSKAVILAMGCRERPRGALNIPGYRPAGIYSAGTAQRYVNIDGFLPGKEVVILGSGDIGLIMARRMTLEGAKVKVVAELMPYSGGLKRNIVQCLEDYGIPLELSTTVVGIEGKDRLQGVTLAKVDKEGKPIPGTERYVSCDTLLLSVGLIPENELSEQLGVRLQPATSGPVVSETMETSIPGVFACGNVLHVHDLVDFVSEEAAHAGKSAAMYCKEWENIQRCYTEDNSMTTKEAMRNAEMLQLIPGMGVRYTVPSLLEVDRFLAGEEAGCKIRFRVSQVFRNVSVQVILDGKLLWKQKKRAMAPGEMEELLIRREWLENWRSEKQNPGETDRKEGVKNEIKTEEKKKKNKNNTHAAGTLQIMICEEEEVQTR